MFEFSVIFSFVSAFLINLFISISAMVVGFPLGHLLCKAISADVSSVKYIALGFRSLIGNIPSFVMLYYFTIIIPANGSIFGLAYTLPPTFNAVLALSLPVIGYSCDLALQKRKGGANLSFRALNQFFLIILMASTTASAIEVTEILATANAYIASTGDSSVMLNVYLLVAVIFTLTGLLFSALIFFVEKRFGHEVSTKTPFQGEHI
ncbi:hypothetical protein [Enterovibrio nigricans]|uniref:Polar amino acid transport system permease protein n=1 Tax=Enterovibrio nigricans DSM 22720 TaxID=1121868 RepID=A0A1T4VBG4_9GAMM|nr:hypothetical protein [Enterovibrio nigricans]PKF49991.1 hypothetical protein AT251_14800 [Enterovibrio nigricans]SKA62310.1 polar amino acid transport system permease protein [Enterovibrio nigricans DSM 22720]